MGGSQPETPLARGGFEPFAAPLSLFGITKLLGLWAEPGTPAPNTQAGGEHANHCTPVTLAAADLFAQSLCKPEFIPAAGCVLCHHLFH